MDKTKPWGGRFAQATDRSVEGFTQSVSYDRRLYRHDIRGSIAHARMLAKVRVLSEAERDAIVAGLKDIEREIEKGGFEWSAALEDVHMNIEARLTERIGEAGKKLHTGRSRNDQIATDVRLYLREATDGIAAALLDLQAVLVEAAEREAETVMPGFTHMQVAQPVTLGHHLLAWVEMFERDLGRLADARVRLNVLPLGSAALAGTSFPLDREMVARELGFERVSGNSLDAVSDRDFALEFAAAASILMVHLSRIAEELVLWASEGFRFIEIADAFCTGSSIMPQKKNPDVAELLRGKAGRVTGGLVTLLMLMKGQPLAYNRDNQEDKEPLFDIADTVQACVTVLSAMLPAVSFQRARMREMATRGYATATDLAEYLVRRGMPFRDAHAAVGAAVRHAIERGKDLDALPLDELRRFAPLVEQDVFDVLALEGSVRARDLPGGTAPARVRAAARAASARLAARRKTLVS
jgi:argininosuccinate lyase